MNYRAFVLVLLCGVVFGQSSSDSKPTSSTSVGSAENADVLAPGRALWNDGKYKEAADAFKAVVEKSPSSPDAQAFLVRSLLRAHSFDDAEEAAKKAVAALPSSALVHAAAGDVNFRMGKFAESETEYRTALKLDGSSARGWFGMGRMFELVSMRRQAQNAFSKAHELDPEDRQIQQLWLESLPRAKALEAEKSIAGEHPSERERQTLKYLNEVASKKPWALTSGVKPTEVKLLMIGNKVGGTTDVSHDAPIHIGKGYGVQVKFNDRVSSELLLDSGAEGVTIGNKLAEKIGVVKVADSYYGGIGDKGPVESYVGWVDKIKIGDVEFHDCLVEVSSRADVTPDSGLIGTDVFAKFLLTLDFRERKLLLAPLPKNPAVAASDDDDEIPRDRYIAPEMQSYTKVYMISDHLFVPVIVNDKAIGTFLIDTGSDVNTMAPRFAAGVTKASDDHEYVMKGVSGKVDQVLTGHKAIIQIAKIRIESHDLPVFALDGTSNSFGTEIAGIIGILTLSQMKMTIDYRDGLVNLEVYDFKKASE